MADESEETETFVALDPGLLVVEGSRSHAALAVGTHGAGERPVLLISLECRANGGSVHGAVELVVAADEVSDFIDALCVSATEVAALHELWQERVN